MEDNIEILPAHILVRIFSFLNLEDLIFSVRHVCRFWRQVADEEGLWIGTRYMPHWNASPDEVLNYLENMPQIQHFLYFGRQNLVPYLCRHVNNLRSLTIPYMKIDSSSLKDLLLKFPNIEILSIPIGTEGVILTKVVARFRNLRSLIMNQNFDKPSEKSGLLNPLTNRLYQLCSVAFCNFDYDANDMTDFLHSKRQNLVHLYCSSVRSLRVLRAILNCEHLETLAVSDVNPSGNLDYMNPGALTALKIFVYGKSPIEYVHRFLRDSYARLTELQITNTTGYVNFIAPFIMKNCTKLLHLTFDRHEDLSDVGLAYIDYCPRLTHLNLAYCTKITEKCIIKALYSCREIKVLNLSGLPVNQELFSQLLHYNALRILILKDCNFNAPLSNFVHEDGTSQYNFAGTIMSKNEIKAHIKMKLERKVPMVRVELD